MIFSQFGTPFGVIFASLASFWEHFGSIFGVKNETVAPKVPQERPKANTPKINSRFGTHVGVVFCRFSNFFLTKQGCKICVCKGAVFL